MRSQETTHRPRFPGTQVLGAVFLGAVEFPQVLLFRLVHHSHQTSNGLAHRVTGKDDKRVPSDVRMNRLHIYMCSEQVFGHYLLCFHLYEREFKATERGGAHTHKVVDIPPQGSGSYGSELNMTHQTHTFLREGEKIKKKNQTNEPVYNMTAT